MTFNPDTVTTVSEHKAGVLWGCSYRGSEFAVEGEFDLALIASSWDPRCVNITHAAPPQVDQAILLMFTNVGQGDARSRHDAQLAEWCEQNARVTTIVRGASEDVWGVWSSIVDAIASVRRRVSRPLRILIDSSAMPRFFSMGLLAQGLRSFASEVITLYGEATYPEETSERDRHEMFTTGSWEAVAVPGLLGTFDPLKKSLCIVTLGFEGSKTNRILLRTEPERVAVLVPYPGYKEEYVERSVVNNGDVFRDFLVQGHDVGHVSAGDAVAAWSVLERFPEGLDSYNTSYLCSGTKPHALGAVLASLGQRRREVLYIRPAGHREVAITPSSTLWTYQFANLAWS